MSQKILHDELLICQNCGLTFLWTLEEQKRALRTGEEAEPPENCPGCRYLLPAPGRERGIVKWFNPRKKFGFIVRREQGEIFVHRAEVKRGVRLRENDLVEFAVKSTERGPVATDVQLLARAKDLALYGSKFEDA
jgi:CspA family cold shock protein